MKPPKLTLDTLRVESFVASDEQKNMLCGGQRAGKPGKTRATPAPFLLLAGLLFLSAAACDTVITDGPQPPKPPQNPPPGGTDDDDDDE